MKSSPILRFKEFSVEWNQYRLGDFTKINQGLQIAISERFTEKVEGSYFYITNEFLKKDAKKNYFIKNPPSSVLCEETDLLMTRTGNTGQVVTGVKGAFHNNFFKIKLDVGYDRWFLFYFLTSHQTQHTILKLAGTSTIPDLNHGDFYKIKIKIPSLPEQQKIASFLSAVDEKIQQLTRKKELLEQYKKGVMQQLFSGKLRFKPENSKPYPKWEERRIDDLFKVTRGNVLAVPDMSKECTAETPYPVYSSQTKQNGLTGYYSKFLFENAITWTTDGANAGEVKYRIGKFYCTNVCGVLLSEDGYANQCISQILNSVSRKYVSYVGNPKLMNNVMATITINIPSSIEEQQKIASFLTALDAKIEGVATQIAHTQTFKKGLLQQMFI